MCQQPRRPHLVAVLFPKVKDHRSSFSGGIGCIKNLGPKGDELRILALGKQKATQGYTTGILGDWASCQVPAAQVTSLACLTQRNASSSVLNTAGAQVMCDQPNLSRTGWLSLVLWFGCGFSPKGHVQALPRELEKSGLSILWFPISRCDRGRDVQSATFSLKTVS